MSGEKAWEVSFYDERPDSLWKKSFPDWKSALAFIEKVLSREIKSQFGSVYNATLYNREEKFWTSFYWSGERIIRVNEPIFLTRKMASRLRIVQGEVVGLPTSFREYFKEKENQK